MSYAAMMTEAQAALRRQVHKYRDDFREWPEEKKARHRKRRALHELLDYQTYPAYRLYVEDGRLRVGPKEAITPEAREFIASNRDDLMEWCSEWSAESEADRARGEADDE